MPDPQVSIWIRAKDLASRVFGRTEGALKRLGISARGLATAFASVAASAVGLGFLAKKLFDLGATAFETRSKFQTVFGDLADQVAGTSEAIGRLAGLTKVQTQESLATTGAMVQGMGFAREESAKLSVAVLRLAGDLTSFNNVPIEDTTRAIQAALTGEREQLKRLGIVLREADVQQLALARSGKKSADSLTQQEKAAATLELITKRAGVAIGDLARTQDSAANRARQLRAQWGDMINDLSIALLPTLEAMIPIIDGIGQAIARNLPTLVQWVQTLTDLAGITSAVERSEIAAITRLPREQLPGRKAGLEREISTKAKRMGDLQAALDTGTLGDFEASEAFTTIGQLVQDLAGLDAALQFVNKRLASFAVADQGAAAAQALLRAGAARAAAVSGLTPSMAAIPGIGTVREAAGWGRFQTAGRASLELAADATKELQEELKAYADAAKETAKATEASTVQLIAAAGQLIQGIINAGRTGGARGIFSSLFGGAGLIAAMIPGVGTAAAAAIGAGGGILSTLIGGQRKEKALEVSAPRVEELLERQIEKPPPEPMIILEFRDPAHPETVKRIVASVNRLHSRDATPVVSVPLAVLGVE